ncbi:GNAT family N-acetyltransferase [Streptomyces kaniharaensis]|uniref:GNAT family N-acetyltransferase n=1 Tax=Streptomyces kaniharaensis TaxID=212423 RepID=A0A6N7KXF1_9ACTN|nr:GNAT family N-acetyltransferase [Streptomyces kaniharaensis]MQS15239.1 GNAT family N-acetyltransferase [Streptomyces kaniharaensis]
MDRPSLFVPTLDAGPFDVRPWRLSDADLLREAAADPYIPLVTTVPGRYDAGSAREFVERQWAKAANGSGYSFAVARRADERAVGFVGLFPQGDGRASIGYWTAASARGQGVAGHALRAVAGWALGELCLARLELHIEPWNVGSLRTAERAGFRREGLLRSHRTIAGERRDMALYALLPADLARHTADLAQQAADAVAGVVAAANSSPLVPHSDHLRHSPARSARC